MSNIERNNLANGIESVGEAAIGFGLVGTVVSGIAFIATESPLKPEDIQRLTTQVDPLFAIAMGSIVIGGAGIGISEIGRIIKSKTTKTTVAKDK